MRREPFPRRLRDSGRPGAVEAEVARHLRTASVPRHDLHTAVARASARGVGRAAGARAWRTSWLLGGALAGAVIAAIVVARRPASEPSRPDEQRAPSHRARVPARVPLEPAASERATADGCGSPAGERDLAVCTATYLGGPGDDAPVAVEIDDEGAVVYAGTLGGTDLGGPARTLLGGGAGAVVRLGQAGRQVLSVTRVGDAVTDMKLDPRGRVLVLGVPFGLAVLDAEARAVEWTADVVGARVAVGRDGTIAVLDPARGAVALFTADGAPAGSIALDATRETAIDLAVHAEAGLVIVVGAVMGLPGQPFVRAHAYDGSLRWQSWGWSPAEALGRELRAAANASRVTVAPDGAVYVAGQSNGGRSAWFRDPRQPARAVPTVVIDDHTVADRVGNQWFLVLARLSPRDGSVEAMQFHVPRDVEPPRRGRTVWPRAMTVDDRGQLLVAGYQACCGERDRTVAGSAVRQAGRDAFVLALSPELRGRAYWHTFGTGAPSMGLAVAARGGLAAMVAVQEEAASRQAPLVTRAPLQPAPAGGADAYLVVWPTRAGAPRFPK